MSIAGAIQPRINDAIEDRLRADTLADPQESGAALEEELRLIGAIVSPRIPLFWWTAPEGAPRPYLVYGPQERETSTDPTRCGDAGNAEVLYEICLSVASKNAQQGIATIDRIAVLLDAYDVTVSSQRLNFARVGDYCYPDFAGGQQGVTLVGLVYRVSAV